MYNNINTGNNIPQSGANQTFENNAFNKLTAFENKNKNSDLRNSYTLLSEELLLINLEPEEEITDVNKQFEELYQKHKAWSKEGK